MREPVDAGRVREFLNAFGRELRSPTVVWLSGGATAVLEGWRASTIDVDLKIVPDAEAFSVLPRLKEELRVNVELAAPDQFLPPVPGWEGRSRLIAKIGCVEFRHFDLYSQALAKLERGFRRDLDDVIAMVRRGLVDAERLRRASREIVPELPRYPAVDPGAFLGAVDGFLAALGGAPAADAASTDG